MNGTTVRYLIYSQVAFFGAMIVCLFLSQGALTANDGLSYYGVTPKTITPYAVGLLFAGIFLWRATNSMNSTDDRSLRIIQLCLRVFSCLLIIILITPYSFAPWVDYLHISVSSLLFVLELAFVIWLTGWARPSGINRGMVSLQFASGIGVLLSILSIVPLMVPAQLAFELFFTIVVVRSLTMKTEKILS